MRTHAHWLVVSTLTLTALAGAARPLDAQAPAEPAAPRFSLAVSGGVANGSYPYSSMSSGGGYHIGVTGVATARARTPLDAVQLRLDGVYADWSVDRLGALTLGADLVAPVRWALRPYVSVGAGGYQSRGDRVTLGYALGAGLRFPALGRQLFVEARAHAWRNDVWREFQASGRRITSAGPERDRVLHVPLSVGFTF